MRLYVTLGYPMCSLWFKEFLGDLKWFHVISNDLFVIWSESKWLDCFEWWAGEKRQ